jgi:hypothetical protein
MEKEREMKELRKGWVVGATLLALAMCVPAQMGPPTLRTPTFQGVWNPVVGQGAVYETTNEKQEKHNIEIAVVAKETVNGKDAHWLQFGIDDTKSGSTMYAKMLMSRTGENMVMERMVIQPPGMTQPIEMSGQFAGQRNPQRQGVDFHNKAERVGEETVTVPAGTFSCEHWRMKDGSGEVWFSPKVMPWGVVKYVGKDSTMVLTKTLTDAKDKIPGKAISMQDLMQQKMQQRPQ